MAKEFVQVGRHYINFDSIVHAELVEEGGALAIDLLGAGPRIVLRPEDIGYDALAKRLEKEVQNPFPSE